MQPRSVPLSITLITLNEERNLEAALQSVFWAQDVVVVDSGSTDQTCAIAERHGARVIRRPWEGYGQQKNFAQAQARFDWVLNLDADERVPNALALEIQNRLAEMIAGKLSAAGFSVPRKTYYLGRWIRHGGWYPNRLVRLADRRYAKWSEPEVHEALVVEGKVRELREPLEHDAFQSIEEQVLTNLRFSRLGAQARERSGKGSNLPLLILKPIGKFFETFWVKRGFLDGMAGFIIAVNAAHSIFLKYAYPFEKRIRKGAEKT